MIGISLIKGVKTLSTMDLPMCKLCAMWQTMGSKQTGVPYLEGRMINDPETDVGLIK